MEWVSRIISFFAPHRSINAENYLKQGVDMLVIGEGEETFYELCEAYLKIL